MSDLSFDIPRTIKELEKAIKELDIEASYLPECSGKDRFIKMLQRQFQELIKVEASQKDLTNN